MSSEMIRGESVLVVKSYDLFDRDVLDCKGIYIKTDTSSSKHLIFFPVNQEWAEMSDEFIGTRQPWPHPRRQSKFYQKRCNITVFFRDLRLDK